MPKTASVDKVWKCGIFPHHTMGIAKKKPIQFPVPALLSIILSLFYERRLQ